MSCLCHKHFHNNDAALLNLHAFQMAEALKIGDDDGEEDDDSDNNCNDNNDRIYNAQTFAAQDCSR